jgi:lipopolysaccharide biosynthesis regulator YciM
LVQGEIAEAAEDWQAAIKAYRNVIKQDVEFATEILKPLERCYAKLEDVRGYQRFLEDLIKRYEGAAPHVALAQLFARQDDHAGAVMHLSEYVQESPNWIGFYYLLELTWTDAHSSLSGPLDSLRESLRQVIERQATYLCGHCGFSGRYRHWQCPSCKQWNSIAPVRDVTPA